MARCATRTHIGLSRPGGLASLLTVPEWILVPVPAEVPALTAVLTEPASVAARAVTSRGRVAAGERVVVSGAGAIGVLAAYLAKAAGADVTIVGTGADVAARGELCDGLGIPLVEAAPDEVDAWIEASGAAVALAAALRSVRTGGRVIAVGLYGREVPVELDSAIRREVSIVSSYSAGVDDYAAALSALRRDPGLGGRLVEVFPWTGLTDAFESIGRGERIKTAIAPPALEVSEDAGRAEQLRDAATAPHDAVRSPSAARDSPG